jgi:K+-transporting ATPase ATPase A chain
VVLPLTGLAAATDAARAGLTANDGPHGFTEILFAYASCLADNGQNTAGLNANSAFYNLTTMIAMAAGRFGLAALALMLAGRFAVQGRKEPTIGTLPCDTVTFACWCWGPLWWWGRCASCPRWLWGPSPSTSSRRPIVHPAPLVRQIATRA